MSYFNQGSGRLIFRKTSLEDVSDWKEFFINNSLIHFLGLDLNKSPEELATNWIEMQLKRYEELGLGHLAVTEIDSGLFIGMAGIIPRNLADRKDHEIAYSFIPRYWGKGYATEAARSLLQYGKQNIQTDRFISIIDLENHACANVARKNGMEILFQTEFLGMDVNVFGINLNSPDNIKN
ncbi:MAG: GNAT family N-acetyltransferase [Bacteroidota bacterium]